MHIRAHWIATIVEEKMIMGINRFSLNPRNPNACGSRAIAPDSCGSSLRA